MVLIFTAEPETLTVPGQAPPADRPLIQPAPRPTYQGVILRQLLDAYRGRDTLPPPFETRTGPGD